MEINVDIDGDQINEMVAKAIIDSALGDQIRLGIEKSVAGLAVSTRFEAPIHNMIDQEIKRIIAKMLNDRSDEIKAVVNEKFTNEVFTKVADKAFDCLMSSMERDNKY